MTHIVWISYGNVTTPADDKIIQGGHNIEIEFQGLKQNKDAGGYSYQTEKAVELLYAKLGPKLRGTTARQPTVSLTIQNADVRKFVGHNMSKPFGELMTSSSGEKTKDKGEERRLEALLPWDLLTELKVLPFELKFSSVSTWEKLKKTSEAFKYKGEVPTSKTILRTPNDNSDIINSGSVKIAYKKFQSIKTESSKLLEDSQLKTKINGAFIRCLERAMNSSAVLQQLIL